MANSQDEKVAWMNDLDECIYALLEKERSRRGTEIDLIHIRVNICLLVGQFTEEAQQLWRTKVTVSVALEDGDYTGYMFKKANNNDWKRKYFLLRNGLLYYFNEKPLDTQVFPLFFSFHHIKSDESQLQSECEARVVSLVWCSVKVSQVLDRGAVFQLATPARIIYLSTPDIRSMFQWIYHNVILLSLYDSLTYIIMCYGLLLLGKFKPWKLIYQTPLMLKLTKPTLALLLLLLPQSKIYCANLLIEYAQTAEWRIRHGSLHNSEYFYALSVLVYTAVYPQE